MTIEELNKMRLSLCLLPPPGGEVTNKLIEEIDRLRHALNRIANPIKHMIQDAKEQGYDIDGHAANMIADDPSYLRGIAADALENKRR